MIKLKILLLIVHSPSNFPSPSLGIPPGILRFPLPPPSLALFQNLDPYRASFHFMRPGYGGLPVWHLNTWVNYFGMFVVHAYCFLFVLCWFLSEKSHFYIILSYLPNGPSGNVFESDTNNKMMI